MIPFKTIPAGLRVPGLYNELDASQANTASGTQRALVIGQITAGASLPANVPTLVASATEARTAGGAGSMLAAMIAGYRANDPFGEVWYLPIADDPVGTAAAGAITIAGPATAAGIISLYIAGQLVSVPVASAATAATIATTLAAAINATVDLPVTAVVDGVTTSKVNVTAKNKGLAGNDIDLRVNYLGTAGGQQLPGGVTVTFAPMAGGLLNPSLTNALAALGDLPFDFIVSPYTDATSIAAISGLLNDLTGRWSYTSQLYGHAFIAKRGTQGALATFGIGLNDQHLSCLGFNDSPSPNYVWSAAVAGAAAVSLRADPGVPLQTVRIAGVLAPPVSSQFLASQRAVLLYDGIGTFKVMRDGTVQIERLITTFQTNAQGQADNSYLDVETLFTLMAVLRAYSTLFTTKFAQVKLGSDGVRYGPGANVVTPATIKAELIALYRSLESEQAWVQNSEAFAASVAVTKNASSPGRVDVLLPITVIGQLRVMAVLVQFKLS
ncbi:phage tail sheath subtilisin-like domain-containing protein [Sphingomonas sp. CBMAI 2297]|uniref:phage tail sheath subtilisin-like domain-containing protein n=1 Tax=Sphingomonas sp. CBMAI 2297 TaxID=2991720 RepID=UPI0024569410|nr:phage tail sheath subtilisin-like domain-containing protein [Sphingomonas sp. CBMAI 2297]MDH4745824.1 phage tail sheath subtilisin-like domain-containing protein [Sphingomonas sp. CBMAI 2297]